MVSQSTRSFTYLMLLFVTFGLETWSSLLPKSSLNIEPALNGATLSIASGSPNLDFPLDCYPPLSSRGPSLDKGDCRHAVADFYLHYPNLDQYGIFYKLTHRNTMFQPHFTIKCPYVITYPNCVFTLDYHKNDGGNIINVHSSVLVQWADRIARACVGKAPQEMVDGGDVTWEYPGASIRVALARTAKPFEEPDGNSTSVGNSSAAFVSSAESNVTFSTDINIPVNTSDSK